MIIAGLGIFAINTLNEINNTITPETIEEMHTTIANDTGKIQIYVAIATITAILIAVCISIFLSKYIMYPVNKLIESAEEIEKQWLKDVSTVGICGATSTPKWLMEECRDAILTG